MTAPLPPDGPYPPDVLATAQAIASRIITEHGGTVPTCEPCVEAIARALLAERERLLPVLSAARALVTRTDHRAYLPGEFDTLADAVRALDGDAT